MDTTAPLFLDSLNFPSQKNWGKLIWGGGASDHNSGRTYMVLRVQSVRGRAMKSDVTSLSMPRRVYIRVFVATSRLAGPLL